MTKEHLDEHWQRWYGYHARASRVRREAGDVEAVSRPLRRGSAVYRQRRSVSGPASKRAGRCLFRKAEPELLRELRGLDRGLVHSDSVPEGARSELRGKQRAVQEVFRNVCGRLRPEGHESLGVL